jgi:subtilase family serine protease
MRLSRSLAVLALVFASCALIPSSVKADPGGRFQRGIGVYTAHACGGPAAEGLATCFADQVISDIHGNRPGSSSPAGNSPADLQSAYGLPPVTAGSGQTVAIVDAYDDPSAASDLSTYRAQFTLPSLTAWSGPSTLSPWFRKVDQNGGTGYPQGNTGWAEEISLDLDMVSAICPKCNILLVEAASSSMANLGAAVNEAASLGANAISNSYGGNEYRGEASDQSSYYNHAGIAITVSSGDSGYGVQFPAASRYVTAVGGTSLSGSITSGWSETAWSGAGSGCSAYIAKPSWQSDKGCKNRTVADVSAVADPNTGVSVYDTYGAPGWMVFGGTSVASPIIASVYALAGNASTVTSPNPISGYPGYGAYPYSHTANLHDVTSGSNGRCRGSYLCTAGIGYDGPTGLGTPNGASAF